MDSVLGEESLIRRTFFCKQAGQAAFLHRPTLPVCFYFVFWFECVSCSRDRGASFWFLQRFKKRFQIYVFGSILTVFFFSFLFLTNLVHTLPAHRRHAYALDEVTDTFLFCFCISVYLLYFPSTPAGVMDLWRFLGWRDTLMLLLSKTFCWSSTLKTFIECNN